MRKRERGRVCGCECERGRESERGGGHIVVLYAIDSESVSDRDGTCYKSAPAEAT